MSDSNNIKPETATENEESLPEVSEAELEQVAGGFGVMPQADSVGVCGGGGCVSVCWSRDTAKE